MDVRVRLLSSTARCPTRAHGDDAAFDLYADESVELAPAQRAVVSTGIALALPGSSAGLVLPRSGLASKHGVTVLNAPGLIDSGYRGEVRVVLLNTDAVATFSIKPGDRVAQLLVVTPADVVLALTADALESTERGDGGFGSTGR